MPFIRSGCQQDQLAWFDSHIATFYFDTLARVKISKFRTLDGFSVNIGWEQRVLTLAPKVAFIRSTPSLPTLDRFRRNGPFLDVHCV